MAYRSLPGESVCEATVAEAVPDRLTRAFDFAAAALGVLVCAALAFLAVNEPWVSDDFSVALVVQEHPGLWDTVSHWYQTWTGRFSTSALVWLAVQIRPVYGVVIWLGLLLLVVLTFALPMGRFPRATKADLSVLGLVMTTYWFGLPALEETVFWTTGSVVYLWPTVAALLFLYQYRRWDPAAEAPRRGPVPSAMLVVAVFALGVFVGASQEQVLVACGFYLVLMAWRASRARQARNIPAHLWAGAVGLVVAGFVSITAPGNAERLSAVPDQNLPETLLASTKYAVHILVDWLPPMMPWLLCFLLLAIPVARTAGHAAAENGRALSEWWVWVLLGLSTAGTLMLHPYFAAERTAMILAVFLVVAAISLQEAGGSEPAVQQFPLAAASAVLCLFLAITAGDVMLSGWQARELRLGQLEREQRVVLLKEAGERNLTLAPLRHDALRRGVIWNDGTTDATFWINQLVASWYGVDSVVIAEGAPQGALGP